MKNMRHLALAALTLSSTLATAQVGQFTTPDFSMITQYEVSTIGQDANVKAYVSQLGGKSFSVNSGKPATDMYGVVTNNGCKFDVKVVYQQWPGIDDILVYRSSNCR